MKTKENEKNNDLFTKEGQIAIENYFKDFIKYRRENFELRRIRRRKNIETWGMVKRNEIKDEILDDYTYHRIAVRVIEKTPLIELIFMTEKNKIIIRINRHYAKILKDGLGDIE